MISEEPREEYTAPPSDADGPTLEETLLSVGRCLPVQDALAYPAELGDVSGYGESMDVVEVVGASMSVVGRGRCTRRFLQQMKASPRSNANPSIPPTVPPATLAVDGCEDWEDDVT